MCEPELQYNGGQNSILHHVQLANIFEDSKTYVDMKLRYPKEVIEEEFKEMIDKTPQNLRKFVEKNFENENLSPYSPEDWTEQEFKTLNNQDHRKFAVQLNRLWRKLGRRMDSNHDDLLSSAYFLPNPVIVPGGRFREVYYWDTYWILKGLYRCKMFQTARGMIENLVSLLNQKGYVPNGGRKYYTRSQPPLLALMVWDYYLETGDKDWLIQQKKALECEWNYWVKNHLVIVDAKMLFIYRNEEDLPRPESYKEDYLLAQTLNDKSARKELYKELRTGAESGWDYSSRWFTNPADNKCGLIDTKIRSIIGVDLNSFLYQVARIISNIYNLSNQQQESDEWNKKAESLMEAIEDVLWNEELGAWFDYDLQNNSQRINFTASCITPLWTSAYPQKLQKSRGERVLNYLKSCDVLKYPGGVPTTLENSGQQWDFPNIWPPLEHIIVQGLYKSGYEPAKQEAARLAKQTVDRNMNIFNKTGHMFEKYNCLDVSCGGSGGEYEVQIGFGWSNGVTLDFIHLLQDSA